MQLWLQTLERSADPIVLTVFSTEHSARVGMISIMNIVPEHGRAELGSIWYTPSAQKTRINTETIFLLLKYLFDDLHYRRVEWKCNNENLPSKRAAERLGFQYEGIFRQHMVIKDRSRDTAWFAMIDKEWPAVRANFEAYLNAQNLSLTELNKHLRADNRSE
jgi:RimJ/RimL family protein N-acetyltransferase